MVHAHSRIKFVEVLLDVIVSILRRHKIIGPLVVGAAVVQLVFLVMWSRLLVTVLRASDNSTTAWAMALLLLLSLRWTCGLIKHVVTVMVSGTVMAHLEELARRSDSIISRTESPDADLDYGLDGVISKPDGEDGSGCACSVCLPCPDCCFGVMVIVSGC